MILADRVEEFHDLGVCRNIEHELFVLGVKSDFQHSDRLSTQLSIRKTVSIGLKVDHRVGLLGSQKLETWWIEELKRGDAQASAVYNPRRDCGVRNDLDRKRPYRSGNVREQR